MHILFKNKQEKANILFVDDDDANHNVVTNGNNRIHTTARINQKEK